MALFGLAVDTLLIGPRRLPQRNTLGTTAFCCFEAQQCRRRHVRLVQRTDVIDGTPNKMLLGIGLFSRA